MGLEPVEIPKTSILFELVDARGCEITSASQSSDQLANVVLSITIRNPLTNATEEVVWRRRFSERMFIDQVRDACSRLTNRGVTV